MLRISQYYVTFISLSSGNLTAQQETIQTTNILQDSDPLTSYASYLRELYMSMSNSHTSQHWTHLPRCEFIQLAMIGSRGLRRGDREEEMVRLAQQGRIETILNSTYQSRFCCATTSLHISYS